MMFANFVYICITRGKNNHFRLKMVIFYARNTNIYKICKLHRAIFSSFYNNSQPNFAILLVLRSRSKFRLYLESSIDSGSYGWLGIQLREKYKDRVSTFWWRWNSRTFPGLSRPFFSKFKDLELGKIFENGTDNSLYSVILIKITNVGTAGG
jgi:hypothetical protein